MIIPGTPPSRSLHRTTKSAALCALALPVIAAAPAAARPALIPAPAEMIVGGRGLAFTPSTRVSFAPGAESAARAFADLVRRTRGFAPAVGPSGTIRFERNAALAPESYRVEVTAGGATVSAGDAAGLYYGAVTLWQLATQDSGRGATTIPAVTIRDTPRFPWRGFMLDSARHYQSPAFIKRFIEWMSLNKLNRFHWHLVDDQGWRLEIRKYPRLTEIGGVRAPAVAPGAPPLPEIGGVYTQAEVRDIVAFAAARGVTVVPEIEMPGHALAALRAYPALGVAPIPTDIDGHWGVFPYLYNLDDKTFGFLEDVLDEVIDLFPSTVIHIGGDEAVKDQWKADPKIQARMKSLGLADEEALQGWFVARIGSFLQSRGRRLIGWDEILDGGVPADAVVMSWRGIDGAVKAAATGHDTVLAAAPDLYLDNRQAGTSAEPPGRGAIRSLADVYAFDPVLPAIPPARRRHILGLQGQLWTEHVRTEDRAEWMAFPRALAIAEVGWSPSATRDFAGFAARLTPQLNRLATLGLRPATTSFTPVLAANAADAATGSATLALTGQRGLTLRYTLDGSVPSANSPAFAQPLLRRLPARIRAASFAGTRALPGAIDTTVTAASLRSRDSTMLATCAAKVPLYLEDDAPAGPERARFLIDILEPCWTWTAAPMKGVDRIAVEVGRIPFNFQVGRDRDAMRFAAPAGPGGEVEVRSGGCGGARVAVLPLGSAVANPGVTRLVAPIARARGNADLCFTYTATGPDPLVAIRSVRLLTPGER